MRVEDFDNGYTAAGEAGSGHTICAVLIAGLSLLLVAATVPFSLYMCVKVVQEYERAVIFRLGRLVKGGAKVSGRRESWQMLTNVLTSQGPGIFFIIPCIDTYKKVDLRTVSFDVPPQEVSLFQMCLNVLECVSMYFNVFQCVSMCVNAVQCVSRYLNMFQYVSMYFNVSTLHIHKCVLMRISSRKR